MKKTILIALALIGMTMAANAQKERRHEKPNVEKMTERMKTDLNLTDDQYKSVYAANEEMIQNMEKAGGHEADRETKNKIRKNHLAKLNEVLTPEQMEKVKERRQKGKEKAEKVREERREE